MIFFQIDKNDKSNHIYQQIYKVLKEAILERKIPINEKLPSKRKLAETLGVSINSVSNAYEQLLAEGFIYAIERKGYYVESITQFNNLNKVSNKLNFPDDLKEEFSIKDEGWISLSHMTTDISMFPFKEWMKCEKIAIKNHKKELIDISHPQGPYLVRKTISRMIALTRGVKCEPEQVIIGPGTQPLIRQVMGIQRENTKAAIENPGYFRIYQLLKDLNFKVFPINLDNKGIDIKKVEALNPNFLFITPSHQFPTGIIMPISRRIELLNWASASEDKYIIEDDYDSEFKYGTDNIPSLQSLDRNQRVIYVGTFSKTIMPSFRISYLVLPPDLLREYKRHFSYWIQGSNTLNLFTLHYFIESGEYARHVKCMNNHYEKKREILIKELKMKFRNGVQIKNVPAGLHFIAEFKTDKGYKEIEERAKKEKLEIYSMKRFNLSGNIEERNKIILVIGFANIKNEDIPIAIDRLYRIIY